MVCPSGLVQTLDGFDCTLCDATCQACQKNGGYRTDLNDDGTLILQADGITRTSRCVTCNAASSLYTGSSCISCKPLIFVETVTPTINSLTCTLTDTSYAVNDGLLFYKPGVTTATDPNYYNVAFDTDSSIVSNYYSANLLGVYRTCRTLSVRNSTACQALGNMCVLNVYASTTSSSNVDPCKAFNIIQNGGTTINSLYGQFMPWLFYLTTYGPYHTYYTQSGTNDGSSQYIFLEFQNKCSAKNLAFYAAQYRLNGSLLSYDAIDISTLQLCNRYSTSFSEASQVNPFSATNYHQSCSIPASTLVDVGKSPIFYDMFLKFSASSNLYPLPAIINPDGRMNCLFYFITLRVIPEIEKFGRNKK